VGLMFGVLHSFNSTLEDNSNIKSLVKQRRDGLTKKVSNWRMQL
jgi:hypothetical protein